MSGELIVQTLKGPTSGANANKVLVPGGHTLDAGQGTLIPSEGGVVQVATTGTTTAVYWTSSTWTDPWRPTFTPKYSDSTLHFSVSLNVLNEASNTTDLWIGWRGLNGMYCYGFGKASLSGWNQNNNAITYSAPAGITTQGELWIQLRGNGSTSYLNYNSGNGSARSTVTMWEVR